MMAIKLTHEEADVIKRALHLFIDEAKNDLDLQTARQVLDAIRHPMKGANSATIHRFITNNSDATPVNIDLVSMGSIYHGEE